MKRTKEWSSFAEFQKEKNRRYANALLEQNQKENDLFKAGYSKMVSLEKSLTSVSSFSLCHNDFSDRNILVKESGSEIKIVGLIDFELSYPSDPESDIVKMLLKNYFNKAKSSFVSGYCKNTKLSSNFEEKSMYYLIALCLDICSWSHETAFDFYQQAVAVLKQLV